MDQQICLGSLDILKANVKTWKPLFAASNMNMYLEYADKCFMVSSCLQ